MVTLPAVEPTDTRFRYVPALDGMRALAVIMVALFHYPWETKAFAANPFRGGFLGVDVFFVLSGFLITSLLLQEHADTGLISLRKFYARRALRLLPAFGVLFVMALVAHFAFVDQGKRPSLDGVFAMLGYMANWVQLWRNDPLGPLFGHTWSLAIEEQFYLVFPILLLVLLRFRLRKASLAAVLMFGAVASALWRAHVWSASFVGPSFLDFYVKITGRQLVGANPFTSWNRWYFGTDTRLDSLLVGATTAVLLTWARPRINEIAKRILTVVAIAALVVAVLIMRSAYILNDWLARSGMFWFELLVALVVVGVVVNNRSWLARLFGLPPLVWIGRRSYAIYLFHLVVYNELGHIHSVMPSWLWFWLAVAVIGIVVELSWRYLEQPFLKRKRRFAAVATPTVLHASPAAVDR